jgi:superfamily II DNA or RNA helicase
MINHPDPVFQGTFFAVSVQEHKQLGTVLVAHICKLLSSEGGIYTVIDNVFPENFSKWKQFIPENGESIVKLIDETSDSHLFKVVGKDKKSISHFYQSVQTDEVFGNYVRSYLERRVCKSYELIVEGNIPTFLKEKNFNNLYHENLLRFSHSLALPVFKFVVTPTETQYSLSASFNGKSINLKNKDSQVICNNPCIIRLGRKVLKFENVDAKKLIPFFSKDFITIPKSAELKYFQTFVLTALRNQIVIAEGFTIDDQKPAKQAIISLETKLNGELGFVLYFRYGSKNYHSHSKLQNEVTLNCDNGYCFTRFSRDSSWEESIKFSLIDIGLVNSQGSGYDLSSSISEYSIVEWVNRNEQLLKDKGFSIEQQVQGVKYYLKSLDLDLKAKLENDWFDIYGIVKLADYEFPFIALRKNILKGIKEFILPNGEVFIIPNEWFAKYKPLFAVGKTDGDKLFVGRSNFGFLNEAEVDCLEAISLKKRFETVALNQHVSIPQNLNAQLRDYQKTGLLWMQILNESAIGGCLADDMGLGKTIQTLSILLHDLEKRNENGQVSNENGIAQMGHTSLLVVPTSLLFNWQREISRFAPSLSVYQFTGPNRTRSIIKLVNYNIVLTTYGVLRNEIDLLKDVRFNYVVLDEGQVIKNPTSKVYRSAMLLKAKHFLALSGTPIENSLTDLWALLNFLNRGMLGSLRSFREEYIIPIEKNNDEKTQNQLRTMVQPFILRRKKHEVAPELPELTEQVVYCNLSEEQKSIYESEKSTIRNQIIENIDSLGYGHSAISILRGLTRLRQIANHPQMIDDYPNADSGKFEEITRTIETLVVENHKILIFSSFVKHLRVVEQYLLQKEIGYRMLIGSTKNRQQIVDGFQNDPSVNVFLISIKAGGVGLNLTAADYIMVLDPWWNPAVENQAIARAHRIGQDKSVFVYRFISVDTVEEKIQRLQEQKLLLSSEFVDNSNPLSVMNQDQILEILS